MQKNYKYEIKCIPCKSLFGKKKENIKMYCMFIYLKSSSVKTVVELIKYLINRHFILLARRLSMTVTAIY